MVFSRFFLQSRMVSRFALNPHEAPTASPSVRIKGAAPSGARKQAAPGSGDERRRGGGGTRRGGGGERPLPALLWRQWTGPAILGSREHGQLRTRCKAVTKAWDVPRASRSQPGTTSPVSRSPRTRSRRGDPRAAFSGTSGCGSGGGVLRQSATGQTHAHPRRLGGAAGAVSTCSSEDRGRQSVGSASPRDKNRGPQVGAQSGLWWAGWDGGCGPGGWARACGASVPALWGEAGCRNASLR